MFIGIARFELFIPASGSLKDKRQVLRSVTAGIRPRFNVSIAEVEYQNLWQRAALGVTCVAESGGHCRKVLQEVEKTIGRLAIDGAEIVDRSIDVLALEDL
ncbi:MAG TPA: DUF503 domain-containing protein [Actinomycetota bacterium]|nr:DUF503 domain-containing protein [Actinomycetota bacterium]